MPMFEDRLSTDEEIDRKVEEYIRRNHSFTPTWEFTSGSPDGRREEEILMSYHELDRIIPERLMEWVKKIKE